MRHSLLLASILMIFFSTGLGAQTAGQDVAAQPQLKQLQKPYAVVRPINVVTADLLDTATARPVFASSVTDVMCVRLRPMDDYYDCSGGYNGGEGWYDEYGYIPGDYSREGFLTESGNWWIGNQPYLPYYSYNPPTIDGYYPPYAFSSHGNYGYGYGGYGRGGGYYGNSSATGIVPAPPLASPPAYIPTFTRPVMPAPLDIRITGRGNITRRNDQFQLFYVPQPPNYLTTGSAIYQIPQQYYNYYYPPFNR